jgi:glutamate synthase domain-containing protein 2/glutamate synthase domain-containing protein 1/glutamate synthase domain-containing protein 3
MAIRRLDHGEERSSCGVGFVALRGPGRSRLPLLHALAALDCHEHRGACLADGITGDGAGVMTDIPFELLGYEPGTIALGSFLLVGTPEQNARALELVEDTFEVMSVDTLARRTVPVEKRVLGQQAREILPDMVQMVFGWPAFCRSEASFNQLLYVAKQRVRTRLNRAGLSGVLYVSSLSTSTVVYKALSRSEDLAQFFPDLLSSTYRTRFCIFHRRFSTNTRTSWDKAQPFRMIAHNGEINTIAGNRSWSHSREQALGLPRDELLTREGCSDSGNLNQMVEALKFRSSMPYVEDVLAIIIPPADEDNDYYRFWSRAAEPWDGPALVTYCDGQAIGARSDRNGFRPCRWAMTDEAFYLASEAGSFNLDECSILRKGTLRAGSGVKLVLGKPEVFFRDPSRSEVNGEGRLDPRLSPLSPAPATPLGLCDRQRVFGLGTEELDKVIGPMMVAGKEPIGSMGDTAALAVLSDEPRSFFDFFFQTFAQVTNPPLDYLRERIVTDLSVYLGRSPNIFIPKELIPPRAGILLDSPVLGLDQLQALFDLDAARPTDLDRNEGEVPSLSSQTIDTTFERERGAGGLREALTRIADEAHQAVRRGVTVLILSDAAANEARPPCPSLLALRAVVTCLNKWGLRLRTSIVVASGDARTPHHVATLIGFGATAVCPTLALELARSEPPPVACSVPEKERESNLCRALEDGLLKIMSKMGISVVRSYASAKLFTAVGLGDEIIDVFFGDLTSPVGGLGLDEVAERILRQTEGADDDHTPVKTYLLKEHNKNAEGEAHGMTAARSRLLQDAVGLTKDKGVLAKRDPKAWDAYVADTGRGPVHLRDLLTFNTPSSPAAMGDVESVRSITKRFGSGSMSFGALSAESQADLMRAMAIVGGRSGSGEGGENPWYYVDGTTASVKQVASARFGVTAEYLMVGEEFEIKIAQGAKPGEGGQLMGIKVDEAIARARFAREGVDLISPPPLHDIYSIEDLKELIYELKQLKPDGKVCVKLVSGANVGTVAVGVVKAGADAIQISGGDGGTGAATLGSMRHAGLPWELGLVEVHRTLSENGLRDAIELRVDGGLSTGDDLVMASILGADGFAFGKLLLIAQGCIMARVCQKNTCPRGIATHDERFLAKYRGSPEAVVRLLDQLAEDVRARLATLGLTSLDAARGRVELLTERSDHKDWMRRRGLDLSGLLAPAEAEPAGVEHAFSDPVSPLNLRIVDDVSTALRKDAGEREMLSYALRSTDRAVLARLAGHLAAAQAERRQVARQGGDVAVDPRKFALEPSSVSLAFKGSAGQGFAVFMVEGLDVELVGEANDSVAKGMSGGRLVVRAPPECGRAPEDNVIIGNCALYGATGGELYVGGRAGDRFAVRNSGARAVVEGVGMHCAEYMTGGLVLVLGPSSHNVGAGMTGGRIVVRALDRSRLNDDYLETAPLEGDDDADVRALLEAHAARAHSPLAARLLEGKRYQKELLLAVPRGSRAAQHVRAAS